MTFVEVEVKPSGLEWVGSIPGHWTTPPVGASFEVQLGKMLNPTAVSGEELRPYLRNANVRWDRLDLDDLAEMSFDAADRLRYALRAGDLLVCEGGEVGRAAVWGGQLAECYYQKALHRVRPHRHDSTRFLMYALMAAAHLGVFDNEGNTSTFVHLTAEKLRAHRFPWPPTGEQRAIVDYLDTATARLDGVLEARGSQLDALTCRRQALIDRALEPVRGSIWPALPVKRLIDRIEQGWSPQCETRAAGPDEWGVLKAGAANGGIFRADENKALPPDLLPEVAYEIRSGDVIVSRANTRSLVASVCVVPDVRPRLLLCDKLFRLQPKRGVDRRFLAYALRTTRARAAIEAQATGTSDSMLNVGQDTIRELRVVVPDSRAQASIADRLDHDLEELALLMSAVTRQVELLLERRQALITAAVTGALEIPGVAV